MNMASEVSRTRSIEGLKARLDRVNRAWTVHDHEALLHFYVRIVPSLLEAERCGIFIIDPASGRIRSKAGTGLEDGAIEVPRKGSIAGEVISTGEAVIANYLEDHAGFHREADARTGFSTRNMVCVPIKSVTDGRINGVIQVLNKLGNADFSQADAGLVQEVADYLSMALDNIVLNAEILELSRDLDREVSQLKSAYLGDVPFIAESEAVRNVLDIVRMISSTPVNVVIQGENGTGKEVIARMIHERSDRRDHPFVGVNCAAIPETLIESELFGYEKGAFTGAGGSRPGRFEEANGGTLFLDEIVDMPLSVQPKLLRAIQEGEGSRLGSNKVVRYDLRIISASNRDLRDAVARGAFREDLFYRLYAVEIVVPPLRERREDIVPMALTFLDDVCRRFKKNVPGLSDELLVLLEGYEWPGNVRQLRREVERLVALSPEGERLTPERCTPEILAQAHLAPRHAAAGVSLADQVRDLEIRNIRAALAATGGNKVRAAARMGITRQGLHKKLKRYGLEAGDKQVDT